MLQRGHSGDGCDLASSLCKYDLRMGGVYLFFSELLMRDGGVRSILLLSLVAGCREAIDVCTWRMIALCLL